MNEITKFSCVELLQAYSSDLGFLSDLVGDEFSCADVDEAVFSCKHSGDLGAFCCRWADDEDSCGALGSIAFNSEFHHSRQLRQQRLPSHRAINLKVEILINLSNTLHMHQILLFQTIKMFPLLILWKSNIPAFLFELTTILQIRYYSKNVHTSWHGSGYLLQG